MYFNFIFYSEIIFNFLIKFYLINFLFVFILGFIFIIVLNFSNFYIKNIFYNYFLTILLIFLIRIFLIIYSFNFLILFFSWDILGIRRFLLILFFRNWDSYFSSINTIIINRFGDFFIIIFLILFSFNYFIILIIIRFLILIASITKRAIFPFIVWLPKAIRAPTPISSLVHRRTLVTAGLFIILNFKIFFRFWFLKISYWFCLITLFFVGLLRIFEKDLKKIVALRTLSQISFCFSFFCLEFYLFFIIHLFSHSFFKRSLFIQRGYLIYYSFGEQIKFLINKNLNILNQRFIINIFCLIGLRFNRGIFSKDFLIEIILSFNFNFLIIFLFLISIVFTFFYSFNLFNILINNKNLNFIFLKNNLRNFNRNLIILFSLFGIYFILNVFILNLNNLFIEIYFIYFLLIIFIFIIIKSFYKNFKFLSLEYFVLFFYKFLSKNFLLSYLIIFIDIFIKFFENMKNSLLNIFYFYNNYKNSVFIIILLFLFL